MLTGTFIFPGIIPITLKKKALSTPYSIVREIVRTLTSEDIPFLAYPSQYNIDIGGTGKGVNFMVAK